MIAVTEAQIREVCPNADPAILGGFVAGLPAAMARFGVDASEARVEPFLANVAVECQGFTDLTENLYYRTPERIRAVWKSRFPTVDSARPYARNPKALACKVYNGRMGNGATGLDGWRFAGKGPMQATGRAMYREIGALVDLPLEQHPEMAADPAHGALIAAAIWHIKGCNALADRGDVRGIRKRINGGTHGMAEMERYLAGFARAIRDDPVAAPVAGQANEIDLRAYQERLRALGYFEVGEPDGLPGPRTACAVMAFQRDHGLAASGELDQATRDAIATAGPRPVSAERRTADAEVLRRKGSETIALTDRLKAWVGRIAGGLGLGAGGIFAGDEATDGPDLNGVAEQLGAFARLKALLVSFGITPTTVILLVAVGAAVWVFAHRIERNRVEEYREGKNT